MKSLRIFSIPTYSYLLDVGMDEIDYDKIFIKFKKDIDIQTAKTIQNDLENASPDSWGVTIEKPSEESDSNKQI